MAGLREHDIHRQSLLAHILQSLYVSFFALAFEAAYIRIRGHTHIGNKETKRKSQRHELTKIQQEESTTEHGCENSRSLCRLVLARDSGSFFHWNLSTF